MVSTVLKSDLQNTIEDQLSQYARQLQQTAGAAQKSVGDTWEDLQRAGRTSLQDVQNQLSEYATQQYNAAQQAAYEATQEKARQAQAVQQHLTDYASQLTQPQAGAQQPMAGQPPSLPHNEEPGTQTDQVAGGNVGSKWKTQFDFGATYTGDYRTGTPHRGVDLVPSNGQGIGAEVDAFAPGTVTLIQRDNGAGGLMVYVQDADGLTHAYMHLAGTAPGLKVGDPVQRGQPIAQMGESGTEGSPHLHYEVRKNASVGDPLDRLIDPRPYLSGTKQTGVGGVPGAVQAGVQTVQGAANRIGQGKDDFINSLAPLAKQFADQTGIDPALMLAIAGHETGWGQSQNAREKNNLFSIQGTSPQGGRWAGYNSPQESFQAFVDLISQAPRYAQAWADRHNPLQFIEDLRAAHYVVDEPGFPAQTWVDATKRIYGDIAGQVAAAPAAARRAIDQTPGGAVSNQQPFSVTNLGGEAPAAKPPLYMSTMQGGEDQAQNPIQSKLQDIQDQLDSLRRTLEPYNQPPLAGAPEAAGRAVGGAAEAVGGAVGGALTRPLGETFPQLAGGPPTPDARARQQQQLAEMQRVTEEMNRRAAEPLTPGAVAGGAWDMLINGAGDPYRIGVTWDDYQKQQVVKNKWIEENNPARDVPLVGGLTTGLAQQLTDPVQVLAFGPTLGVGRALGVAAGERALGAAAERMSPMATRIVSTVAEKLTSGAFTNGVQGALFEAVKPDADPLEVAKQFVINAVLGGVIDVGSAAAAPYLRRLGQQIKDAAPELLRARQRGEVDLGLITTGEPTPREAPAIPPRPPDKPVEPLMIGGTTREPSAPPTTPVAGVQRPLTYAPAGSPEAAFDELARTARESSPDGRAHIDLNTVDRSILPFAPDAPEGQGQIIKTNPGGMPHLDDLRALYEANQHKRSFYVDQGDEAANIVGGHNTAEFFTNNSITSQNTGVSRQVAEAIQAMGIVRQVARDGRAAGLDDVAIRQNILDALNDPAQNPLASRTGPNKRKALLEGYSTGEATVQSGAKTSSFAGNYESAEGRFFDPRVTNDIHNWRIMNVASDELPSLRTNKKTGVSEWFYDRPHEKNAANNDRAYRGVEAVWNEMAREYGVDGYSLQSAMWDGMRAMQLRDPEAYRLWQQGHFRDAIEHAKAQDVFRTPTDITDDPGDIQRVMNSDPVKRMLAKWGDVLNDPLPRELGIGDTVQRSYAGKRLGQGKAAPAAKPSTRAFREEQRILAEAAAPVVHGLDRDTATRLGYDPERGIFPWLETSHRVVQTAPDEYVVHLPAGNEDTARYVAAQVGRAADAERVRIHVPDYREGDAIGVSARGTPDEVAVLQHALDNMGITSIVGTGKRSLQVPLRAAGDRQTINAVQDAAVSVGFPESGLAEYTGRTADVPRSEYAPTSERLAPTFAPTTAERSDLLQRGLGAVPPERGPPRGRQRGEADIPFAINIGGAAAGGYAGYAATPEDASLDERLRNIGLGATAGLLGTRAITGGRLGRALEARAGAREGFQAPRRPEGPELRATTQEPPGGPTGREPRTLGEVRSNPYALREAAAGETPMTTDEMLSYADELEQRLQEAQNRRDAVQELIRNPGQKIDRPGWAAGLTDLQVAEIARSQGASPYEEAWYDRLGLEPGSGEVRDLLREGGWQGIASQTAKKPTMAQLRAESASLEQEIGNITAAHEQMTSAPAEPNLVRVRGVTAARDLPFDTGAPADEGPVPVTEAQGGLDEGARLVQEVILSKNRGTLRSTEGDVTLQRGDVKTTALVSHQAIQEATATPSAARTAANMPNLDALLENEPEIAAQIRKVVEDHQDAFELYRQGVVSMDSLRNDLAKRVGMSLQDWNKTKIGQAFNPEELMALQAAAVEQTGRMMDTARTIVEHQGGVDSLSPEELVFAAAQMADTTRLLTVARGGRTTAGRTLNALKQRFTRYMAQGITESNEQRAAQKLARQAREGAKRATAALQNGRVLEREANTAKAEAARQGVPRGIIDQIAAAYDELDRYNAMTLHEKGVEFDRLKAERAKRAEARKAVVRGAPEELLSALKAELKAEQKIFAGRKNTWEEMAFWDSKAAEKAVEKRTAFRGQLYIEQQRKVANIAAKAAEKNAAREFNVKLEESQKQQAKAERLLQEIGGREVTANLLKEFIKAANDPSPEAAAKFLKGMAKQNNWARANMVRVAGLVSGPLTTMVNLGGNAGNAIIEVPTRALVVGIDALRAAATGGERQAYKAELLPMMQAYGPGFVGSLPNVVRVLKTGINPIEAADLSKVRAGFNSGNAVVDAAAEMPLRVLTAEDIAFRSAATSAHAMRVGMREATREGFRGNAAKGRAANIAANLEDFPELAQEVADAAARQVFQERRAIPLVGGALTGKPAVQEAGRLAVSQVAPFVRTPTNITAQGIAMSPIGFGGALEAARGVREMPTGTRAERYARGRQVLLAEERAARAVIGTTVLGAGVALGMAGMLTAAYPEDEQARSALPQGWRPWSLKISDPITKNTYYVPLQNFAMAGLPLAMAAIATDPVHRGKTLLAPDEWGMAVTGIGKYVLDNTFLQGMSDFIDALQDPQARGSKFGESLVASYGPYSSLFREVQRSYGVAGRNPREGLRGLVDAFAANYPIASGTVPPALTPLGDERTQGATGLSRLAPVRYDIERDEPTLKILRATGVGIPKPPKSIGIAGGSIELTEDERAQIQQMRGQAIRSAVATVRQDPSQVQRAVDLATAAATKQFINQLGSAAVNQRWERKAPGEPYYLGTAAD